VNPFDLPGPQFLGFYAVFSTAVLAFLWANTRGPTETRATLSFMTADPYRIAFMRKGTGETLQLAIFNLVDRGLLDFRDGTLRTLRVDSPTMVRRPLDQAILHFCREPRTVGAVEGDAVLQKAVESYRRELSGQNLVVSEADSRGRGWLAMAAVGLLGGVAIVKILVALSRGRHNVAFLVILAIVACVIALVLCNRGITAAGKEMLSNLKALTRRLMLRADTLRPGGATNEALLLASVYGLWALPSTAFPMVALLFPRLSGDGGGDGGGSSSDGGGGGCGGGCGGCGGE
jgi:uncharacterized protein (TIGR04222 family)